MKKLYIAALLAIASIVPTQAKTLKWGVEGGLNLSKMSVSKEVFNSNNRLCWFIGPKVQATLPIGLCIDGALQYMQSSMSVSDAAGETSKTLPYIVIPVNAKWAIGVGSYVSVYFATGPQWNWYVGDKSFSLADYEATLASNTFSWNFGVGIHALKHLQVGVNYNLGFGKSFADVKGSAIQTLTSGDTWRNNQWQLRVAYMF